MEHNWAAVVFLGAGLRCGWVLPLAWFIVFELVFVGLFCMFLAGCRSKDGDEEAERWLKDLNKPPVRPKDMLKAKDLVPVKVWDPAIPGTDHTVRTVRTKDWNPANGMVKSEVTFIDDPEMKQQHRTSPGEFVVGKKPKFTAASWATTDRRRNGTPASGKSSKTGSRSKSRQWRQEPKQ